MLTKVKNPEGINLPHQLSSNIYLLILPIATTERKIVLSTLLGGEYAALSSGNPASNGGSTNEPMYREVYADPNAGTNTYIEPSQGGGNYQSLNLQNEPSNIYHQLQI